MFYASLDATPIVFSLLRCHLKDVNFRKCINKKTEIFKDYKSPLTKKIF